MREDKNGKLEGGCRLPVRISDFAEMIAIPKTLSTNRKQFGINRETFLRFFRSIDEAALQ